jgi:hypothetical protein
MWFFLHRWRIAFFLFFVALTVGLVHPQGGAITGLAGASMGEHPDLQHFAAFLVLAVLAWAARFDVTLLALAAALLAYGVAGEFVQMVIPGRTASFMDGLANVLGVAAGLAVPVLAGMMGAANAAIYPISSPEGMKARCRVRQHPVSVANHGFRRSGTRGYAACAGSAEKVRGCAKYRGLPSPARSCRRFATPEQCRFDVSEMWVMTRVRTPG